MSSNDLFDKLDKIKLLKNDIKILDPICTQENYNAVCKYISRNVLCKNDNSGIFYPRGYKRDCRVYSIITFDDALSNLEYDVKKLIDVCMHLTNILYCLSKPIERYRMESLRKQIAMIDKTKKTYIVEVNSLKNELEKYESEFSGMYLSGFNGMDVSESRGLFYGVKRHEFLLEKYDLIMSFTEKNSKEIELLVNELKNMEYKLPKKEDISIGLLELCDENNTMIVNDYVYVIYSFDPKIKEQPIIIKLCDFDKFIEDHDNEYIYKRLIFKLNKIDLNKMNTTYSFNLNSKDATEILKLFHIHLDKKTELYETFKPYENEEEIYIKLNQIYEEKYLRVISRQ